jgi:hypothetical protein
VVNEGQVPFENEVNNFCIYVDVLVGSDTVRIYNAHLQSFRLNKKSLELFDEKIDIDEIQKVIKWQDNAFAYFYYSKDEKFCNKLVVSAANSELMYFANTSPANCKCNAKDLKALKTIKDKAVKGNNSKD